MEQACFSAAFALPVWPAALQLTKIRTVHRGGPRCPTKVDRHPLCSRAQVVCGRTIATQQAESLLQAESVFLAVFFRSFAGYMA